MTPSTAPIVIPQLAPIKMPFFQPSIKTTKMQSIVFISKPKI